MKKTLLTVISALIAYSSFSQTEFTEVSDLLGVNLSYGANYEFPGNITFCDFDQDGWDDLTLSTGPGDTLRFFRNNEGTFEEFLIPTLNDTSEVMGVNWLDIDNDGDLDFFLTRLFGTPRIFKNNGLLNFTEMSDMAGLDNPIEGSAMGCWGDINGDGFLDLFIPVRDFELTCYMFLNNGDFTFDNVTESCGVADITDLGLCAGFIDYDNDNDLDLFLANDKDYVSNRLYQNDGSGHFTDVTVEALVADSIDAMSVTVGDYNNDGYFDIYVSNSFPGNLFLKNNGDGTFTNIAFENGTAMESIGWGAQFLDGDNDADLDLYVSGMLTSPGVPLPSAYYLYDAEIDSFSIPSGIGFNGDTLRSFSNAIGDINNDGFADLVIHNMFPDSLSLYRNNGNTNNWLKVNTQGTISNRDGIGARLKIVTSFGARYNFTMLGEGYIAQNSFTEFFGLDTVTTVDSLIIKWPSGHADTLYALSANQTILVIEGETVPISAAIAIDERLICEGDSTLLTAVGDGITYLWSTGETTPTIYVGSGMYNVTITNIFSNAATSTTVVISTSDVDFEMYGTIDTCGLETGTALLYSLSDNIENWEWSTGETTDFIDGLSSGWHSVTVFDTLACIYIDSVFITEMENPEIFFFTTDISCYNLADGTIETFTTGLAPYLYNWEDGATTVSRNDLENGWYFVEITDANDCIVIDSVEIFEPDELVLNTYSSSAVPDMENGTAWVTVVGGTMGYSYFWNDPLAQITDTAWTLPIGVWTVWVIDNNGCKDSMAVIIEDILLTDEFEMNSDEIKIFPNPSDGYFNIQLSNLTDKIETVSIFNSAGQLIVHEKKVESYLFEYTADRLQNGTYLIKLTTVNDKHYSYKIIIN